MSTKLTDTALFIALLVSVTLNVVQMRTINQLRAASTLAAGARLSSLPVADLDGRRLDLPLTGTRPTLLYVFSPQCGWCDANQAAIDALVRHVRGRYHIVGVSLTDRGLHDYLRQRSLPFPVYHSPADAAVTALHLDSTPQTIVLSPEGTVERVWPGAYAGRQRAAIQSYFGVELPVVSVAAAVR